MLLTPVYKDNIGVVPQFYFGSRFNIWLGILKDNFLQFILGVLAVLIGFAFLAFTIYNCRNSEVDQSLAWMGLFAIHVGVWKITDTNALALLIPRYGVMAYLPFLSLLLVVVPFVLFAKELFTQKEHMIWYVLCFASFFIAALSIILQVTGVADLRETLRLTHAGMLAMVIVVLIMLFWEWRTRGWNRQLRLMVICMCLCLVGFLSDLAIYYISGGGSRMVMGMFGFLVYIVILGAMSIRETKKLMKIGMKARRYERMAYHDQLTGLYNRTAYAERIGAKDFVPENCIAVMFDLNNLKKCNDTQGHEQGDRYITCSSDMIKQVFEEIGKCYRMGGDEFCVLLKDVPVEECRRRIEKLKKLVEAHNREYPKEFPVQIACGYELFDKELDFDFGDTLRRADKMMYHEKFMMKHGQPQA